MGAVALVGCGSDDGEPAPTATSPAVEPTAGAPTAGATPTIAAPVARWSPVAAQGVTPGARRDPSLTAGAGGKLYLFGGRTAGVSNAELWEFDTSGSAWRRIEADGPTARFGHVAFWDGGRNRLVIATGQGDSAFFDDVWAFDPASSAWSRLDAGSAEHPEIRYGSGGAWDAAGDRLLLSHGFTDVGRFDDTWSFDFGKSQWAKIATTGATPIKRCLLRTLWVPGRGEMLLFGGQTDGTPFLGDFWSLDPAGGAWAEQKPPVVPGPRNLAGASLDDGGERWYLTGGNTPDGPTSETWVFDLGADAWSQVVAEGAPPARYSLDAAISGGVLYAFGGNDGGDDVGELWGLTLGL
ncbi:MAG: hypothetical protein HY873_11335 [Chloroflexi bacterium]|nr:hypothetical protein [Chloroflexota bacterium]